MTRASRFTVRLRLVGLLLICAIPFGGSGCKPGARDAVKTLAVEIAGLEKSSVDDVLRALENKVGSLRTPEAEVLARKWAQERPRRPPGIITWDRYHLSPEPGEDRVETIASQSICELAVAASMNQRPPSEQEIRSVVTSKAAAQLVPPARIILDVKSFFEDVRDGDVMSVRIELAKLRYCS